MRAINEGNEWEIRLENVEEDYEDDSDDYDDDTIDLPEIPDSTEVDYSKLSDDELKYKIIEITIEADVLQTRIENIVNNKEEYCIVEVNKLVTDIKIYGENAEKLQQELENRCTEDFKSNKQSELKFLDIWKRGSSYDASLKDGIYWNPNIIKLETKLLDVEIGGIDIGARWSLPGASYDPKDKLGAKGMGATLSAEIYAGRASFKIPIDFVDIVVGGQYGLGASVEFGFRPGQHGRKRIFGASLSAGPGIYFGLELQ